MIDLYIRLNDGQIRSSLSLAIRFLDYDLIGFNPPKSMRGGIQICYPHVILYCGSLDQHRFAREKIWVIGDNLPTRVHKIIIS
ncbi:unnamed protein product [Brassica rapa subsp. narinosa]